LSLPHDKLAQFRVVRGDRFRGEEYAHSLHERSDLATQSAP
jgi:hypothetical protein